MPNKLGPHLEQRILAFSLAHPGFGPPRISAELAREKSGGLRISQNGVWRCLRRHGLSTRTRRLQLVAGYAARYERRSPESERHIEAARPGELVGVDCLFIGRLSGTKGALAVRRDRHRLRLCLGRAPLLGSQPRRPQLPLLVERVASELAAVGWRLEAVISDNGSEFRSREFGSGPCAGT